MGAFIEHIDMMGEGFAGFALPMLVQSSALILALLLAEPVLRRKVRAVHRYWVWVLALVSLVVPNVLVLPARLLSWVGPQKAYASEGAGADFAKAPAPPAAAVLGWEGIALIAWVAVAAGILIFLLQRAVSARRIIAESKDANNLMKGVFWYCRTCMGVKGKVRLKISEKVRSPAVCGLFRPVILVPHELAPSLGSRHLRAVLLHELGHIKRGDLWVNLIQTCLQTFYFYNPLLWVANRMIRRIREQAVDETVVAAMGDKASWYPESLINVSKLAVSQPALSLHMIGMAESRLPPAGRIRDHQEHPAGTAGPVEVSCGGVRTEEGRMAV